MAPLPQMPSATPSAPIARGSLATLRTGASRVPGFAIAIQGGYPRKTGCAAHGAASDKHKGETAMKCSLVAAAIAAALITAPLVINSAAAQTTAATTQSKTKKPPSAGQKAMRERQRKCGAEWKQAKAAGKIEKGMNWPKYWSACNKRLKTAG